CAPSRRPRHRRRERRMRMILLVSVLTAILGTTLYQVKIGIDRREGELLALERDIRSAEREIAVLEAEWAHLSRPERVLELSNRLLEMKPIPEDRVLPIDAIPMRILPNFDEPVADVGVITLLPPEPAPGQALGQAPGQAPAPRDLTRIAATPDDRVTLHKGGVAPQ
ncbi:MAG: cell division protein FtsL, partial [Candidatus Puniceispirillaceae bacterium]